MYSPAVPSCHQLSSAARMMPSKFSANQRATSDAKMGAIASPSEEPKEALTMSTTLSKWPRVLERSGCAASSFSRSYRHLLTQCLPRILASAASARISVIRRYHAHADGVWGRGTARTRSTSLAFFPEGRSRSRGVLALLDRSGQRDVTRHKRLVSKPGELQQQSDTACGCARGGIASSQRGDRKQRTEPETTARAKEISRAGAADDAVAS